MVVLIYKRIAKFIIAAEAISLYSLEIASVCAMMLQ